MRRDYEDVAIPVEVQKAKAFNALRSEFDHAMRSRFEDIKDNIEDIWDMVTNKTLLDARMKTLAAKDIGSLTAKNLLDISIICCILWNDTPDPE